MTRVNDRMAPTFLNEGVGTCFALLGDADMNWATRTADGGCRMTHVRQDHCAMATMTFTHKTGSVGVATTTCGPGLTRIITDTGPTARLCRSMAMAA